MKKFTLFTALLLLFSAHSSFAGCADTEAELDAMTVADFSVDWKETTAKDGKPMLLKMSTRSGKLYMEFEKTREGVWAEGPVEVCADGKDLLVKMDGDDIELGPRAPLPVRVAMGGGARFKVQVKSASSIHVSTSGWKGDFVP